MGQSPLLVVLSNLPLPIEGASEFFVDLCGAVAVLLNQLDAKGDVKFVSSLQSLEEICAGWIGDILVFSNFPPNSAYSERSLVMARKAEEDGIVISQEADGYDRTKTFFAGFLGKYTKSRLVVITGAPFTA